MQAKTNYRIPRESSTTATGCCRDDVYNEALIVVNVYTRQYCLTALKWLYAATRIAILNTNYVQIVTATAEIRGKQERNITVY